ncbi:MAG: PIN domain-containing protein [Candidatus Micrarchaeota archaeon]
MTATFDTWAWIEYFAGSKKGERVKAIVDSTEAIVTPSLCLLELKAKYLKENKSCEKEIEFVCFRSKIAVLSKEIALRAAEEKIERGLHASDAVVYATAVLAESKLFTGDPHLRGFERVEFL